MDFKTEFAKTLATSLSLNINQLMPLIEIPPNPTLGDFAFPCFTLAKTLKKAPHVIAQELALKLTSPFFSTFEATGPYLNAFFNKELFAKTVLTRIEKEKEKYGSSKEKEKRKIMIEFSQPNTHKAFHVGHIRGTSLGESISRILEFNQNKIIRANYSGDTGMHIAKWIWCYQNFHKTEKLTNDEAGIASIYVDAVKRLAQNEDLQKQVDEINRRIESKENKQITELWEKTRKLSIESWTKIYNELETKFDVHFFESEVEIPAKKLALSLVEKNIAIKSDEAIIMDLKPYNLGVWVLLRKDGTVLYSAKDLALADKKIKEYPADEYYVLVADEQHLHFQQLLKTLELMKFKKAGAYKFFTFAVVKLPTGKMSSRTGDNIIYSDFMKEITDYVSEEIRKRHHLKESEIKQRASLISIAAIKFSMLKQDPNKIIIFDKKEALNFEGETGPYLQYTHARATSILKKATLSKGKINFELLNKPEELAVINLLSDFPSVVLDSANHFKPHLICHYLLALAQAFNSFYHSHHVLTEDKNQSQARLLLVKSTKRVLSNGLTLLGITPLNEM